MFSFKRIREGVLDSELVAAWKAVTIEDIEFWIERLEPSFEQGSQEAAESIERLENIRDIMKEQANG